ncbi:MAG: type II toxin-antitoxin system ParD family antitoxin [Phycisphaerae bacterium]|nr:type II toxin-antitoxin system ParD family antitoxin [Phycisphaerae bacterium]
MNISLTKELESMIHEAVDGGRYHTASEVIRDALRLFQEQEQLRRIRLQELRKEIAVGLKDVEEGRVKPLDFAELKAKIRSRRRKRA